jgi:hypothetical protein
MHDDGFMLRRSSLQKTRLCTLPAGRARRRESSELHCTAVPSAMAGPPPRPLSTDLVDRSPCTIRVVHTTKLPEGFARARVRPLLPVGGYREA